MGFQFVNGVSAEGDPVCIFTRHDQISLNYCEWVEIARTMSWKMPDGDVQVLEEIPIEVVV